MPLSPGFRLSSIGRNERAIEVLRASSREMPCSGRRSTGLGKPVHPDNTNSDTSVIQNDLNLKDPLPSHSRRPGMAKVVLNQSRPVILPFLRSEEHTSELQSRPH